LGFESSNEQEEEKIEPSPKGGFSAINLFSKFNLSIGTSKNEIKKEDGKDPKNNPNKDEILKVNSLVQQYTQLAESNKATLHQELNEIKNKLPKWHKNILINIKILKAMNRMKQTTAFVAEGYVPVSDMNLFDQLINEICENMGRIAYEDKDEKNNTLLITGIKANEEEK
ncbi:H+- or Na+-translocating F-type, V-type and A-type ATPase (F-ATPase) Superfamily, partial [Pseudoloma neurophilia]